ncbi:MAG TPA: H-X9-DG-CTERM domain-containing protein, partial [Methylomirabilota bacterium]|nr:H-X9-DG-CTERM domain-containing protein [Methylomirabilota bacterium]
GTVFLADAAQINDFQPPASPEHPMLEEFYYVNASEPTAHFRHQEAANVVFSDGHVNMERSVEGSVDTRLPDLLVARLPRDLLVW